MVIDLGGGASDVTIIDYFNNCVEVLSTVGDMNLGGQNFDNNLIAYCIKTFDAANNTNC